MSDYRRTLWQRSIDALHVRWAQPLELSNASAGLPWEPGEMIGAVYKLSRASTRPDQILMHAAALLGAGHGDGEPALRMMRRAGLTTAEDNNNESG